MPDTPTRSSRIAQIAAALTAASLLMLAVGLLAAQTGLLAPVTSFMLFAVGTLLGGLLCGILGLIGVFLTRGGRDPLGARRSWWSLIIGAVLLIAVGFAAGPGANAPPINDITNNLNHPPRFVAAKKQPGNFGRKWDYPMPFVLQVQEAYPDLHPFHLNVPPEKGFALATQTAQAMGWTIYRTDPQNGVFEASDRTPIFGFVDDVSVRVRPDQGGSAVDIRSKSRDGKGDLGANAARIRAFGKRLEAEAGSSS